MSYPHHLHHLVLVLPWKSRRYAVPISTSFSREHLLAWMEVEFWRIICDNSLIGKGSLEFTIPDTAVRVRIDQVGKRVGSLWEWNAPELMLPEDWFERYGNRNWGSDGARYFGAWRTAENLKD